MALWDEPNIELELECFGPLTASITMEVKNIIPMLLRKEF